jgi:hypothetical protein
MITGQMNVCVDVNYSKIRGWLSGRRVAFMAGQKTEESEIRQWNI